MICAFCPLHAKGREGRIFDPNFLSLTLFHQAKLWLKFIFFDEHSQYKSVPLSFPTKQARKIVLNNGIAVYLIKMFIRFIRMGKQ